MNPCCFSPLLRTKLHKKTPLENMNAETLGGGKGHACSFRTGFSSSVLGRTLDSTLASSPGDIAKRYVPQVDLLLIRGNINPQTGSDYRILKHVSCTLKAYHAVASRWHLVFLSPESYPVCSSSWPDTSPNLLLITQLQGHYLCLNSCFSVSHIPIQDEVATAAAMSFQAH